MGFKSTWRATALAFLVSMGPAGAADYGAGSEAPILMEPVASRLSGSQYRQIIADIFGPTIQIGGRFEPELRQEGLIAVGASSVSVTASGLGEYDKMARSIAAQVVSEPQRSALIPCVPKAPRKADDACAREFLGEAGKMLFRRPLTKDELKNQVAVAAASANTSNDFYSGLATSLWTMLVAPEFLFRQEFAEPDPAQRGASRLERYSKASRLSFFLWNAAPDPELMAAAERGELNTPAGLTRQVDRLLASPRLEAGVRALFADMLGFDAFATLAKDAVIFPKFSFKVAADAEEQTLRTIAEHLVVQRGDYRELFTTRETFLTPLLASIYSVPVDPDGGWQPYTFTADDPRLGILSHVSFTALHSHPGRSSPTLRGKALREVLLCQKVPLPPGNVDFTLVDDAANPKYKTAKDRLKAHASEAMCAGCHKIMDPIGLALENFDSSGGYRTSEHGAALDTSGELDGQKFRNATDLGQVVRDHPAAPSCLVNRTFAYGAGRVPTKTEATYVGALQQGFADDGYRVPALLRRIVLSNEFYRVAAPGLRTEINAPTKLASSETLQQESRK